MRFRAHAETAPDPVIRNQLSALADYLEGWAAKKEAYQPAAAALPARRSV